MTIDDCDDSNATAASLADDLDCDGISNTDDTDADGDRDTDILSYYYLRTPRTIRILLLFRILRHLK